MRQLLSMITFLSAPGGETFDDFGELIKDLYSRLWGPMLGVLVGGAALLGLWLGLKFLFAGGDEQKTKKAKESVKFFVIGIALIFIVAAGLPVLIASFQNWQAGN